MQKNKVFDNYQLQEDETEFNSSTFQHSDFSKCDLSSYEFVDCIFNSCDFSMSLFENTILTRVKFVNCKMLGVDFSKCSKFNFLLSFELSILNYCFFSKHSLKKTVFNQCVIKEATFSEIDLSSATFNNCDLSDTIFERCNLEDCDFRTAQNYRFNPSENKMKKAKFSYPGVIGLLSYFNIIVDE